MRISTGTTTSNPVPWCTLDREKNDGDWRLKDEKDQITLKFLVGETTSNDKLEVATTEDRTRRSWSSGTRKRRATSSSSTRARRARWTSAC
ncbi:hypothetical protein ZEAMMB73_Zm00001d035363 [Zea mays]|uniref:Uncharacterized protein n=1 Tax=Zea mays TaxID=4577 RepID=A0A1D6LG63_MAIZE|nr:hypothetical protein ZEAMMB73_Zm00001d035363 [Zea mays]